MADISAVNSNVNFYAVEPLRKHEVCKETGRTEVCKEARTEVCREAACTEVCKEASCTEVCKEAASTEVCKEDARTEVCKSSQDPSVDPNSGIDPLVLAYLYIFDSVQTGRDTAQIQAKEIENNATQQNNLISEEAQQNFATLKWTQLFTKVLAIKNKHGTFKTVNKKVAQKTLDVLGSHNQEISAIRSYLEDKLNVTNQYAQINETNLNDTMATSQQSVQQGGSLMQMLTSLTNQISRI